MRYTTIGILFLSLLAATVVSYLAVKAQQSDTEQYSQTNLLLGELRQLDTGINEEILKARLAIITDYVRLQELYSRQHLLHRRLSDEANTFTQTPSPAALQAMQDYLASSSRKEELNEQFQIHNAALRGSINAVPIANQDFLRSLPGQWYEELLNPARELTKETLEYASNPLAGNAFVAKVWIEQLQERRSQLEPSIQELMDNLLSHVNTVLAEKGETDDLLLQLLAIDTPHQLDRMSEAVNVSSMTALQQQDRYRLALAGFSALLIVLLVYAGFRLRAYYQALQMVNESLEQKVVERTAKLSTALDQLKNSQAQLIQSEKMASLGQMVAGVAHEINTPLGYAKSNIFSIKTQLDEMEALVQAHRDLLALLRSGDRDKEKIKQQSERVELLYQEAQQYEIFSNTHEAISDADYGLDQISDLVGNLKNFSRLDRARIDEYDVNAGLDNTLAIAKHSVKNKMEVERDFSELPKITCSPSQINQVFLNMITNAAQAIDPQKTQQLGHLKITTRHQGNDIHIVFRDNGCGIPSEIAEKIFDPFFTTKPIGEGTGLGLSISHQIVHDHGGEIKVHSSPERGTRFVIRLPISRSPGKEHKHNGQEGNYNEQQSQRTESQSTKNQSTKTDSDTSNTGTPTTEDTPSSATPDDGQHKKGAVV
jgi:C4-dicarboxylate-specific signal transduction histidine kinase